MACNNANMCCIICIQIFWNKILPLFFSLSSLFSLIWPFISGVSVAERMASSRIHSVNGGWSATQKRIHCYLSNGVAVREGYGCFLSHSCKVFESDCNFTFFFLFLICVLCFDSCREFKKGSKKGSCRENSGKASKSIRLFWNHMGMSNIYHLCKVTTGGCCNISELKAFCVPFYLTCITLFRLLNQVSDLRT